MSAQSTVALWHGEDRATNLRRVLAPVLAQIDWSTRRNVVIKPNLVIYDKPLACTHRDALEVVLQEVRTRYTGRLTIAEGGAVQATTDAFAYHGYYELAKTYDARLYGLNVDQSIAAKVYTRWGKPIWLHLARTVVESDCRISLALPKTHDSVIVTLTLKNIIMGSLVHRRLALAHNRFAHRLNRIIQILWHNNIGWGNDKRAMHQGYQMININLARLAPLVWPHVSVLDGYVGMEGDGPVNGTAVPWDIALAGTDALAVDALAAHMMGYPPESIGYLSYCARIPGRGCADLDKLTITGNTTPATIARTFQPHPDYEKQGQWHHPRAEMLL